MLRPKLEIGRNFLQPQRHRLKKSLWQQLENEYQKDMHWDKQKYIELSHKFQLSYTKLYKWRWNRIKTGADKDSLKVATEQPL